MSPFKLFSARAQQTINRNGTPLCHIIMLPFYLLYCMYCIFFFYLLTYPRRWRADCGKLGAPGPIVLYCRLFVTLSSGSWCCAEEADFPVDWFPSGSFPKFHLWFGFSDCFCCIYFVSFILTHPHTHPSIILRRHYWNHRCSYFRNFINVNLAQLLIWLNLA